MKINKELYLLDLSKCLVTFGIRGVMPPLLAGTVEQAITPDVEALNFRACENLLFYLDNTNQKKNTKFVKALLAHIQNKELVD